MSCELFSWGKETRCDCCERRRRVLAARCLPDGSGSAFCGRCDPDAMREARKAAHACLLKEETRRAG